MMIQLEEIPTGGGRWTVHIDCGPGMAHTEETWLGAYDEVHARLLDKVHEMTGVKQADLVAEMPVEPEPAAPKRGWPRSTPTE